MEHSYPILEFDPSPKAIVDPSKIYKPIHNMPEHIVLCFFHEVVTALGAEAELVTALNSEIGSHPLYVIDTEFGRVGFMQPGVGAPLSGAILEELIGFGATQFIACGGAGVLDNTIAPGHLVIPTSAIRDEGLSYHYLPPGREVTPSAEAVEAIETTLNRHEIAYRKGKAWTTDAIFRETPDKVKRRKAEGCLVVEMEASAFFAIAQFRGVTFGQILYGGDDVSGIEWDDRNWIHGNASTREKLFWLAVEAVTRL